MTGGSQESPYGTFGQLGSQIGHQAQGSHLGGFGGGDYGYGESQRVCFVFVSMTSLPPSFRSLFFAVGFYMLSSIHGKSR